MTTAFRLSASHCGVGGWGSQVVVALTIPFNSGKSFTNSQNEDRCVSAILGLAAAPGVLSRHAGRNRSWPSCLVAQPRMSGSLGTETG